MAQVIDQGTLTIKITRREYSLILEALHLQKATLQWVRHQGAEWADREEETTELIGNLARGANS